MRPRQRRPHPTVHLTSCRAKPCRPPPRACVFANGPHVFVSTGRRPRKTLMASSPQPSPSSAPPRPSASNGRDPALDGLRGLALLLLMVFSYLAPPTRQHGLTLALGVAAQAALSGGILFLTLSGFLLTAGLWETLHSRSLPHPVHWLRNFYARRALRIFPLYYAVLGLATLLALARGTRLTDLNSIRLYAFFLENLPFLTEKPPSSLRRYPSSISGRSLSSCSCAAPGPRSCSPRTVAAALSLLPSASSSQPLRSTAFSGAFPRCTTSFATTCWMSFPSPGPVPSRSAPPSRWFAVPTSGDPSGGA
jgi:hypothetical protein